MIRAARGILTYIPGVGRLSKEKLSGETSSVSYCYGVWLKHLVLLFKNGMKEIPETMLELGPGSSIGVGIAAVISGVSKYYSIDITRYSEIMSNIHVFEQLVDMFKRREPYPDMDGFPDIKPFLNSDGFPEMILTSKLLEACLNEQRLEAIRNILEGKKDENEFDIEIKYFAPWNECEVIQKQSADLIISHAVLEHIDNVWDVFPTMCCWLKDGGYMSHQIDFSCHGMADKWNGHWSYPTLLWKLIKGHRAYSINRLPYSYFEDLFINNGLKIVCKQKEYDNTGISRGKLTGKFRLISDDDLICNGAFLQAVKCKKL